MSDLISEKIFLSDTSWLPILVDETATIMPTAHKGVEIRIGLNDEASTIPFPVEGITFNHPVTLWAKGRKTEFGGSVLGVIKND